MSDVDRLVADGIADGRMTDEDAAVVLKFAEFLRKSGPPKGPWTDEQRAFNRHTMVDPEWREFLGLNDPRLGLPGADEATQTGEVTS